MSFEPILLTPQKEVKERYPYRRVWRTAIIETVILLVITVGLVVAARFWTPNLTDSQRHLFGVGYALLPFILWVAFSFWGEHLALLPRPRLFTVAILGALVANAIGIPLINKVFAANDWLANAPGLTRIIGYTLTAGVIQEFLKYAVVRYSVWPGNFRIRSDGIAYAMAAAIGYATALNLNFAVDNSAAPQVYALRIAELTLTQVSISTVMGYFLSELKLTPGTGIFWLPGGLLFAALLNALSLVIRGGLIVGGISATSTANNAFQGLGAAVFLVVFLFASFYFLINNADERARLRRRPEYLQ